MRVLFSTRKPISSPGRTDKFPPPLMRFLRSNVASKSRGKNRSKYPLFLRRNKKTAIEATQEPSSPKVTCIGQVRVRRSKSKSKSKPTPTSLNQKPTKNCKGNCCFSCCFKKSNFLCCFKNWKPDCKKWVFFNCRRSVRVRTDSSKFGSNQFEPQEVVIEEEERNERQNWLSFKENEETSKISPPKNALLLTRCRSAPYRSSSLASQFWGSPLRNSQVNDNDNSYHDDDDDGHDGHDDDDGHDGHGDETKVQKIEEQKNSTLEIECKDSTSNSRGDQDSKTSGRLSCSNKKEQDLGVCVEVENNNNNKGDYSNENKSNKIECEKKEGKTLIKKGVENEGGNNERVMVLKRCKSEPRRRDLEELDPQSSEFWKQRRLGNTQSSTPH